MDRLFSIAWYFSLLALVGLGMSVMLQSARFLYFGIGIAYLVGGYTAHACLSNVAAPTNVAISVALGGGAVVGATLSLLLWRALEMVRIDQQHPDMMFTLSFLGYLMVQSTCEVFWGSGITQLTSRVYDAVPHLSDTVGLMTIGSVVCILLLLRPIGWTSVGVLWRAVADNPELASYRGLPRVSMWRASAVAAGLLAGFAGGASALTAGIQPFGNIVLYAALAILLGGAYSLTASLMGCAIFAVTRQVAYASGVYRWEDTVLSIVFLTVVLIRPTGVFNRSVRPGDEELI
jgi:branched-chain amino acid transport system permease protein